MIKNISLILLLVFYVFFFGRTFYLKLKSGRKIKSNGFILNCSIFYSGTATLLYILQMTITDFNKHLLILLDSNIIDVIGIVLLAAGLLLSSIASLNLGNSWRIGINENEKTDLVTGGIYSLSRNPYFLSYDIVLLGISLLSGSLYVLLTSLLTAILFHQLILKEEKYLEQKHGKSYLEYKGKVRRYL